MEKVNFFTKFNPPPSPALVCKDASLTRQEFVQEADLNNIMKRYAAGMPIPQGTRPPMFGDFTDIPDYQKSFEIVEQANERFAALPSEVRKRFDNDPMRLLGFINDANNRDEAIKLGLIEKPAEKPAESVSVPGSDEKGEG